MTTPPNRKCWNANREIHIGTCADSWDGVFCVCDPADEPEYLDTVPLYVGATIDGVSSANIKAYFNDIIFDTYYAKSSSYIWMWADYVSNGAHGIVRFDLCSGNTVIDSRSTKWVGEIEPEPEPCEHGDVKTYTCEDGSEVVTHFCMPPHFAASGDNCESCARVAAKRMKTCEDGTTIATHDCVDGKWVETDAVCGEGCVNGTAKTKTCADGSTIITHECVQGVWYESDNKCPEEEPFVCDEGELRGSIICPDSSVIHAEICQNNKWIPTNYKCEDEEEPFVCDEGELRGSIICPDSSVIHAEICQNNKWIPTNYKCEDEEEEEPEPEPDDDNNWFIYALVIVAALSFYFLATRGSS